MHMIHKDGLSDKISVRHLYVFRNRSGRQGRTHLPDTTR